MRFFLSIALFFVISNAAQASEFNPVVIQLKYAPWGVINADEQDFSYFGSSSDNFEKYDMHFERSIGGRLIVSPFYIAATRSTTNLNADIPDAIVETVSVGIGGPVFDINDSNVYLIGAFGAGKGRFKFKDPDMNDWEAFFDANAEIGLKFDFLMIGTGVDWQLFGKPGETKANYWNLYLGTGITF